MSIEVLRPGALSTFQDLGRIGYQRFGVHVNGAMDERAHRTANWLVGNAAEEATLEITLLGPSLRFNTPATIALCGADLSPEIDGRPLELARAVSVAAGQVLGFGARRRGVRAYLAVGGGYTLPAVMGSRSTNTRAGFGGLGGRPLRKGYFIGLRRPSTLEGAERASPPAFPPEVLSDADAALRLLPGRHWDYFSEQARQSLLGDQYEITSASDRMGYRLAGPALPMSRPSEFHSEAVCLGTIQVPADGQPIILMQDRGTTGGYPKMAEIITVDIPRLAQMMPGETLKFELTDLAHAQGLLMAQARVFAEMDRPRNPV